MKHQIDPTVDCVFKAILGSEENKNLLVHFLNAMLSSDLKQPITTVSILNPYNDKEHLNDKLSIVDVKARDSNDQLWVALNKRSQSPTIFFHKPLLLWLEGT